MAVGMPDDFRPGPRESSRRARMNRRRDFLKFRWRAVAIRSRLSNKPAHATCFSLEAPMTDKKHEHKPDDVGFDEAMKADDVLRKADEGEIEKAAAEALEADAESKPKWK